MEAKDTVMTGEQMSEQIQIKTKKWSVCNPEFIEDIANIIAQAQAEISFKAGIREVVEWVEAQHWKSTRRNNKWQNKLKEWGIE